jgi:O-antigen/teichoic acid export membrane protein
VCAAFAAVCLLAPSMQHRLLFRREQKRWLVTLGSRLMIAGMTSLAASMTLSLVLVSHFLYGTWAAWIAGVGSALAYALIWYALPLDRRRRSPAPHRSP